MAAAFPAPDGFRVVASDVIRTGEATPRVVHPDPGLRLSLAPQGAIPAGWYQFEFLFPPEGLVDVVAEFNFEGGEVLWLRLPVIARNHFLAQMRLERTLERLTLTVTGSGHLTRPLRCAFTSVGLGGQFLAAARRGADIFRRDGFRVVASGVNYLWRLTRPGSIAVSQGSAAEKGETPYATWIRLFDEAPERDRARHSERLATLADPPLISILVQAGDEIALKTFARAIAAQIYPAWEFVIAAPAQDQATLATRLVALGIEAAKLRVVDTGANAAEALNACLSVSQGDFVLPLDANTQLRPHSLLELALTVASRPAAALVYADGDVIDQAGQRGDWHFRPAWSPRWFAATDYLGSIVLLRRAILFEAGGWHNEPDARHELLLRLTRATEPHAIVHLAKLLAHTSGQGMPIRRDAARDPPPVRPRVSLIIPTRDGADVLATCVRSIRALTHYPDYEILIVDNGSVEAATRRLFDAFAADPVIRILPRPEPFNFSRLNNSAVREAAGAILAFVNNDIEVTHPDWLDEMVALASRREAGCIGAKLLYPDGRLQHAGVVVGLGGVAGHAHRFAPANDPGYLGRLAAVHEVSAVTAACLVIRRDVFDAVGGFDEDLAVAFNDVDFCLKVRAAGYLNMWTPFAELIHHESVSRGRDLTPAKAKRFAGEYATMQRRWGAQLLDDPYYSPHLTYDREDSSLRLR